MPLQDSLKLEEQRQQLIRAIEIHRPQGSLRNKVTVVFDGKHGIYGGHTSASVNIVFSHDEPADEVIKRMVDEAKNKKVICVVTDDKGICSAVRTGGADILSVDDFMKRLGITSSPARKRSSGKKVQDRTTKNISNTAEYKINKEFKDIWLKKDNH